MIIRAPSRLHMSLIDLNGSYKRIDGGIGLALSDPQFVLESEETNEKGFTLEFADGIREDSREECLEKIPNAAEKIAKICDIESGFHFKVLEAYPAHSGLGSGTQIAVCTAHLMTETAGLKFSSRELSTMVGRGGTSGIGTFAHDLGGFIVDGGVIVLLKNSNLFFHLITPLLSIITFILFEKTNKLSFKYTFIGTSSTIIYSIFYTTNVFIHIKDGKVDQIYDWYYFVQGGLHQTFFVLPIMLIFSYIISLLLWYFNRRGYEYRR